MEAEDVGLGLKVIEVALVASVKFLLAPFAAEGLGFNFWQSFAMTTAGGMGGIVTFYYAGTKIAVWWRHLMALIKSVFIGSLVAANLYRKKKGVLLALMISLLFWSLVLNGLAQLLALSDYIPDSNK
jgi:hypothetical protein